MLTIAAFLIIGADIPVAPQDELWIPPGSVCSIEYEEGPVVVLIPDSRYLLQRSTVERILADKSDLERVSADLDACAARECNAASESSVFDVVGWPLIAASIVSAVAGGVVLGVVVTNELNR